MRATLAWGLRRLSLDQWDRLARGTILKRYSNFGQKVLKIADLLGCRDESEAYELLTRCWYQPPSLHPQSVVAPPYDRRQAYSQWMMERDLQTYLCDDILTKVDRASMAVSLECRVPFLDPRLVAWSRRLPLSQKIQHGSGKRIVRSYLAKYLPRELFDRPKMGFSIPLAGWLRGPLKGWADQLLADLDQPQLGLNRAPIAAAWKQLQEGRADTSAQIWTVLMLLAWARQAPHLEPLR